MVVCSPLLSSMITGQIRVSPSASTKSTVTSKASSISRTFSPTEPAASPSAKLGTPIRPRIQLASVGLPPRL